MAKRGTTALEKIEAFKAMVALKAMGDDFFAPSPYAGMALPPSKMVVRTRKDGKKEAVTFKRVTVGIESVEKAARAWRRTKTRVW